MLITGGAGFIGSHVVEKAIELGHHVSVLDNQSTGRRKNVHSRTSYYFVDISHQPIMDIFIKERPEIVVHLAAQSAVPVSVKSPLSDALSNVIGTLNVLEAARHTGARKVIFASTAAVYGNISATIPLKEEWSGRLLSPYAVSKSTGEHYLRVYQELYGLSYTTFRFANVYGPRQLPKSDGGVIAYFLENIRQDRVLPIYGDGEQTRDFIYVEDVAEAIVLAFERGDNALMNLSTGTPTSINRLLDQLEKIMQKPLSRSYKEERPGDIRHSYLCNERLRKLLGWAPRFSLQDGLLRTWQYQS
ncbi:NAD-dependent epimerase/dehydratase family protein [Brevibacillus sp. H7]|uniref:NAD-dependent epimerase/dehydratase family protein n=1 Tax=Brevibacillus sp. H7 TaxID=3349138 RepID=UPI0037F420B9